MVITSARAFRNAARWQGLSFHSQQQPEERQPDRTGRSGTTMITKSTSIILLLMAALLLGTIASIQAQSQPRLQPTSFDNSTGPYNPNQPQDEPGARRRA
jgi:hypothetical protein